QRTDYILTHEISFIKTGGR
ncbi:hypothetical protein D023_2880B, partial [Vibrio parahaemolyticus 3256]